MKGAAVICLKCFMDVRDPRVKRDVPAPLAVPPVSHQETRADDGPGCLFMGAGLAAALALGGYAALLFGYQAFIFLHSGEWVPLPATFLLVPPPAGTDHLSDLARFVPSLAGEDAGGWMTNPREWIGVHRLLFGFLRAVSVPGLSLLLAFVSFNVLMWAGILANERDERRPRRASTAAARPAPAWIGRLVRGFAWVAWWIFWAFVLVWAIDKYR